MIPITRCGFRRLWFWEARRCTLQLLSRALGDQNRTVRAMSAQALGQIGDQAGLEALRSLAKRDPDPFVRAQTEKAMALLSGPTGTGKRVKLYLNFGPFTGGAKSASPESTKIVHDTLQSEHGKLPIVTLTPTAATPAIPQRPSSFWIDGRHQLDDVAPSSH